MEVRWKMIPCPNDASKTAYIERSDRWHSVFYESKAASPFYRTSDKSNLQVMSGQIKTWIIYFAEKI